MSYDRWAEFKCAKCGFDWNSKSAASDCCICYVCGSHTEYQPCDGCYADRHCEGCDDIYRGDGLEDAMHYGCHEEGQDEDTLCHTCWLDRQPALVQLADCAGEA